MEAEAEVRGGEDGESFRKYGRDGFFAGEVRVELVSVGRDIVSHGNSRGDIARRGAGV